MNTDIFILLWLLPGIIDLVGCYDGYTSCSKPFRTAREWSDLPCDFKNENWCNLPGSAYPWHAVRRFVFENHGLMKRMYGEQRHFSVLRSEIDSNDLEFMRDAWHGYNEGSFKKYEGNSVPTILRKSFAPVSSGTSSSIIVGSSPRTIISSATTTSTTSTTNISSTSSTSSTTPNIFLDNVTMAEITFSTMNEEFTTTEETYSTLTEELPQSTSTSSTSTSAASVDTKSTTTQPQIFQESTSEMPTLRLKGVNACPVKEEMVAPFWANNTRGEVLALLNLYPFEQYVHWERCTNEHKQMYCRKGCRCEQQYRLHRLLAYDPTNDCRGIFSDWFKFPSCCVCKCYDIATELRQTSRSPRGGHRDAKLFPPYFPHNWSD